MKKNRCSSCGRKIKGKLTNSYDENNLKEELRYCQDCLEDGVGGNLFEQVGKALSKDNQAKWEALDLSTKADFAHQQIYEDNLEGGTPGQLAKLKAIAASGI